jgi:tRNA1(Val) A37 N6-methylase TrmN6
MQNRFVLTGLPRELGSTDGAQEEFQEYVEDETCWIDRFAWIQEAGDETLTAGMELDLENVRNQAVSDLNGRTIQLTNCGCSFTAHAAAATSAQSDRIVELCADNGKERHGDMLQTIPIDSNNHTTLQVHRTKEGGTGAEVWKGGLLLARQICWWFEQKQQNQSKDAVTTTMVVDTLFHNQKILELGAGSAGLPSMALASLVANETSGDSTMTTMTMTTPKSIIASDAVDEVLDTLRKNIACNHVSVEIQSIDWNRIPESFQGSADTILFADCVYTEAGARLLCKALQTLLSPNGTIVGVLPEFRVGVNVFETAMRDCGFEPTEIPIIQVQAALQQQQPQKQQDGGGFHCAGGSSVNYRLISWSDGRRSS